MSTSLPERPDLGQLRRQAKELRDAARRQEAGAVERFARHHRSAPGGAVTLAAAQLVIARELGFASWPRLKATVEAHATGPGRRAEAFVPRRSRGACARPPRPEDTADPPLSLGTGAIADIARHGLPRRRTLRLASGLWRTRYLTGRS